MDSTGTAPPHPKPKPKRVRRKYKGQIVFWGNGQRVLLDDNPPKQSHLGPLPSASQNRHLEPRPKQCKLDKPTSQFQSDVANPVASVQPTLYNQPSQENSSHSSDHNHGRTTTFSTGQTSNSIAPSHTTPPFVSNPYDMVNELQYDDHLRYQSENLNYIQRLYDGSPSNRLQIFALFDSSIDENGRQSLNHTVSGVHIVTVQNTIFENNISAVITACDCSRFLSEFRSDILEHDFPQTDLSRFVQESGTSLHGQCVHTRAVLRYMYQEWSCDQLPHRVDISEIVDYLSPKLTEEPRAVPTEPFRTSIHPYLYILFDLRNRNFYKIHYHKNKWRCNSCPATTYCRHIIEAGLFKLDEEDEEDEDDDEENWTNVPEIQGYSRRAYPLFPDERLQNILFKGPQRFFPVGNNPITLGNPNFQCPKCHSPLHQFPPTPVIIFDTNSPVPAYVIDSSCPICSTLYPYDGYDKALLRHRTHIFTYELVSDFLDCCIVHGASFYGYWNNLIDRYLKRGYNPCLIVPWRQIVNVFRSVVLDFIRLLQLPTEKPCCNGESILAGYHPTCGAGVKKTQSSTFHHPWLSILGKNKTNIDLVQYIRKIGDK
ncbi:hypothetical protein BKA69DRAFT_1090630 [Paraphysoderma sedebokerense]|nr:hypothetical protein BKA69DRAFT_1090630 [Paraphysoderma sedebokerense]